MTSGTTGLEIEFTFAFTRDGQPSISAIRSGEHLVKVADEQALWNALPDELREQLVAEAWRDAEPEQDDWFAEDARISKEVA
jgi:hypothetical protein